MENILYHLLYKSIDYLQYDNSVPVVTLHLNICNLSIKTYKVEAVNPFLNLPFFKFILTDLYAIYAMLLNLFNVFSTFLTVCGHTAV